MSSAARAGVGFPHETLNEIALRECLPMTRLRLWLLRLFLVAVWFLVYAILPAPFDSWLRTIMIVAFGIWLYNRVCGRIKLPPLMVKFERTERITLTHILLALILIVMFANHAELAKLNDNTIDVQSALVNLQNSVSDDADDIKSNLDDVKSAIEATQ